MSESAEIQLASVGILKERLLEYEAKHKRQWVYSAYVNVTPTPDNAHPAVHIVEAAMKEHHLATLTFYANAGARFRGALAAVEALES